MHHPTRAPHALHRGGLLLLPGSHCHLLLHGHLLLLLLLLLLLVVVLLRLATCDDMGACGQ
jgi:hypothetical protein